VALTALIFDLDDTLYPELDHISGGFRAVACALAEFTGISPDQIEREFNRIFHSAKRANVFDEWLRRRGLPTHDFIDLMVSAYRNSCPPLRMFADAAWALAALRSDYRLGLLTDGRSESQRYKIEALGLEGVFLETLVTDEVALSWRKPSPLGFDLLLSKLDCRPEDAVYVGDNPAKDFLGPAALGMRTVRVRRPCGLYRAVEAATPFAAAEVTVATLLELPAALTQFRASSRVPRTQAVYHRRSREPLLETTVL
jgi:putative hydrolase of the HAD superfamily